jgi:predicted RND superfamily exporter protein
MRASLCSIRWLPWLVVLSLSAVGLRHYRVDNDLAAWMPDLATPGPLPSYVVIGFDRGAIDASRLAGDLRARPAVALCIDPLLVETAGAVAGIGPEQFVVSKDGDYLGIFAFRRPDTTDEALVADVKQCLTGVAPNRYALGGPAIFHLALNQASQQRLPAIAGLIILVGAALLRWTTGSLRVALSAMLAVTISQVILLGLMSWRGLPVDMATSMVPPLMMSLGFSYAAHRAAGRASWTTLALCLVTTALGLGSFVFSAVAPVRSFALNGILGLVLVWLAVMTLVPQAKTRRASGIHRTLRAANIRVVTRGRPWVLAGTFIFLAGVVGLATRVRFQTDPLNYFAADSRVVRDFKQLNQRLTGMLPFQITAQGPADPQPLLQATPGVRKVINIASFVDADEPVFWCLADNDALPRLAKAQRRWQHWASAHDTTLQWRGVAAQLHETGRLLLTIAAASLPAMAAVAGLAVALVVRRRRLIVAGILVNLAPVAGLVFVAGMLRWPVDLPSLMIGAISIGVAVDDTLHLARSYVRRGSPTRAMVACWRPCAGSSLVAAACMCVFALSPFGPTAQFGVLMAAAILFALAGDLILLPVLLARARV